MNDHETIAGMPQRSATSRGFVIYDEFTDTYDSRVRVQESSIATDRRVWIFAERGEDKEDSSPHLDVERAKRVRDALNMFIRENEPEKQTP